MTRWLDPAEARAWRSLMEMHDGLSDFIGRQLRNRCGLSHADYQVLAHLSEATEGQLRSFERMLLSPEQGASATLRLVTDPGLSTTTGAYFVKDTGTATSAVSYDLVAQQKIWNVGAEHFGTVPSSTDVPPPACVR